LRIPNVFRVSETLSALNFMSFFIFKSYRSISLGS
jgi:hypothetical protein